MHVFLSFREHVKLLDKSYSSCQVNGQRLSDKLIHFAESLGGVETLITYPTTQTHADVPEEIRIQNGITDSVLRLSVGIEDENDLISDLRYAIESFPGNSGEKKA